MHRRFNDTWTLLSDMVLTLYIGNEQLSWTSLEMWDMNIVYSRFAKLVGKG